ncbi:MAG: YheT family hydrolase [Bryobacteraceae bacterium]
MTAFRPLIRSPHLQTIAAHYWKRPGRLSQSERRLYRTEPRVEVLVETDRPDGTPRGQVVLLHGLEGSSQSSYMLGMAAAARAAGLAAHRFNFRTCGGTEHLCETLYHAGLTSDLRYVLEQLPEPAFLVGFSLGGNVALKLAGELGEEGPRWIRGVAAISTPLDLAACARRIGERDNLVYEGRFVRKMRARLRATGRYPASQIAGLVTLYALDDRITAPSFGFGTAECYYRTQSALGFLDRVRVPVLLIQARDDTFVPFETFERAEVRNNPHIELLAPSHGGHLGFLGRRPHRFWAEDAAVEWMAAAR